MKPRYLLASDFDGTLFRTFTPSPNGVDVHSAYTQAFTDILGPFGARAYFSLRGENFAPYELVWNMFNWHRGLKTFDDNPEYVQHLQQEYQKLMEQARNFFDAKRNELKEFIPEANGNLSWNQENPLVTITQMVVGQKLKYLCDEIGKKDGKDELWPQPTAGAVDFVNTVAKLQGEGVPIDFAVISSGHELFIKKAFDLWDLPHPDILVTDDDVRTRKFPREIERRFKPGQLPLALAHQKWLHEQGIQLDNGGITEVGKDTRKRIRYFGDDPHKDGGMAFGGKVKFGWYHEQYASAPHLKDNVDYFTHWKVVTDQIVSNRNLFDGRPINAILKKQRNTIEGNSRPAYSRERR